MAVPGEVGRVCGTQSDAFSGAFPDVHLSLYKNFGTGPSWVVPKKFLSVLRECLGITPGITKQVIYCDKLSKLSSELEIGYCV